jgi:hypothetical protein
LYEDTLGFLTFEVLEQLREGFEALQEAWYMAQAVGFECRKQQALFLNANVWGARRGPVTSWVTFGPGQGSTGEEPRGRRLSGGWTGASGPLEKLSP